MSSCPSQRLAAGGGGAGTGRPTIQDCVGCIGTRPCQTMDAGTRDRTTADMASFLGRTGLAQNAGLVRKIARDVGRDTLAQRGSDDPGAGDDPKGE